MLQGIKIAGGRSALGADFGIFVKKVLSRGAADLDGENKTVMYNIIEAWHWKGLKIFFFNVCLRKCQLGDYVENLVLWMFMWEVLAQIWPCRFYLCNQSVVSLVPKIFDRMFLFFVFIRTVKRRRPTLRSQWVQPAWSIKWQVNC